MPQVNPMDSLQTLLRLKQPSHVQTGDPFLSRRQSEIASGLDEWVPEADSPEFKFRQIEDGARYGVSLPRADYRSSVMAKLRGTLGLKGVEHQQDVERESVAPRIHGQFGLQERELANRGALDVERQRGQTSRELQDDFLNRAEQMDPTRMSRGGVSFSMGQGDQNTQAPTGGQTAALAKARQTYQGGGMNSLRSMFGFERSGRQDYESALTDVLARTGKYERIAATAQESKAEGLSAAQVIAEAQSYGVQLDPYEQEYLKLVLGS